MANTFHKASVIIPSYRGSRKIKTLLNSILFQTVQPSEIIVVIDNLDVDTERVVHSECQNKNIQLIKHKNIGRANTRNEGAKWAKGDLLIFYDDDVRLESDSIEKHVTFHNVYNASIISGQVPEDFKKCTSDFHLYKSFLSRKWTDKFSNRIQKLSTDNIYLTAANFSTPKNLFEILGGFDIKLSDAEDYDLAERTLRKGYNVFFDKTNIAWHDDYITCEKYIMRQRQYVNAHKKLIDLKSHGSKDIDKREIKLTLLKKIIFYLFAWKFWVKLIDKEMLIYLPRSIRYKIYDLVVTGLSKVYQERDIKLFLIIVPITCYQFFYSFLSDQAQGF